MLNGQRARGFMDREYEGRSLRAITNKRDSRFLSSASGICRVWTSDIRMSFCRPVPSLSAGVKCARLLLAGSELD